MIRLNLMEAAERAATVDIVTPVRVTDVSAQVKTSKKKTLVGLLAALFVFVAFSCFISVFGVPKPLQGVLPGPYLSLIGAEDPSRTALTLSSGQQTSAGGSLAAQNAAAEEAIKHRNSLTVKQVVGEVKPQVLFNNKREDYSSFLPMEKISFQRAAINQFFTFLTTATPDDVGFSDCVFQSPNYFYVRGVSVKPTSQRSFLERIKQVSSDFRTPPLPENAPATDITAFGLFNVNNINKAAVSKFVNVGEVADEVKAFKALAAANKVTLNGFDKPVVEEFGVYKRFTYQVTSNSDFPELQSLMSALDASPIRIGVTKAEMKFAKRAIASAFTLVMFVTP
ncbi:hypothetical protein [Fibrobacter sp.]|uniref:hypothetical protein n=1 Tax=Fibrobacter sp. TaxID=35828 RepID=UPI0025BD496B|nr:hypothetical protein [Fibrobacter sp.]MBR2057781.1 hypothetical protein [Fibrobacter sp.]MBR2308621.1 hypothetical protein [Fibrobacter sp.]MBR4008101.1 hypothetical protein [Fibrobacter sp.]